MSASPRLDDQHAQHHLSPHNGQGAPSAPAELPYKGEADSATAAGPLMTYNAADHLRSLARDVSAATSAPLDTYAPAAAGEAGPSNAGAPGDAGSPKAAATKSTGRRRKPTAVAMAASEQAAEGEKAKAKGRQRKRSTDASGVSRTNHGGVKIGGRAVTWVGGAGMSREVCKCSLALASKARCCVYEYPHSPLSHSAGVRL